MLPFGGTEEILQPDADRDLPILDLDPGLAACQRRGGPRGPGGQCPGEADGDENGAAVAHQNEARLSAFATEMVKTPT